jgi:Ca-activated chloride channel homolog
MENHETKNGRHSPTNYLLICLAAATLIASCSMRQTSTAHRRSASGHGRDPSGAESPTQIAKMPVCVPAAESAKLRSLWVDRESALSKQVDGLAGQRNGLRSVVVVEERITAPVAVPAEPQAPASQQNSVSKTTGAISGIVSDAKTNDRLAGVTIVATSPSLQGEQVVISEENGSYFLPSLPPGIYSVTFYYNDTQNVRNAVSVKAAQVTLVTQKVNMDTAGNEVVVISGRTSVIDQSSTNAGVKFSKEYTHLLPVSGRSFGGVLGSAPGSQQDTYGVSAAPPPTSTETYGRIDDNPYISVAAAPLSTFSIDVDTASYSNVRRFVRERAARQSDRESLSIDAVRVEEWLNYFHYADIDHAPALKDHPLAVVTEVAQSPWHPEYQLVRIAARAPAIADAGAIPPRNLVFLIDVSGSMSSPDKLGLIQRSLVLLVAQSRKQDRISIVVYAGTEGLALASTPGDQQGVILDAIANLSSGGSTNGAAGITLAYEQAKQHFVKDGVNRVILCTDGDFNVGLASESELTRLIETKRDEGVFLTVLGVGQGNIQDNVMEQLADHGNGNYAYIDSLSEAYRVLVKESDATLVAAAKDVKLQVEFNPAHVAGYRLIGYENRLLRDQDFNDDKKDAGDMGAGHAVTALYEVIPAGFNVPGPSVDGRKYNAPAAPASGLGGELLTVKMRYKHPTSSQSKVAVVVVRANTRPLAQASESLRWAAAVASAGMLLRGSPDTGDQTWCHARELAASATGADADNARREFLSLMDDASGR